MITNNTGISWKNIYSNDVVADVVDRAIELGKIPVLCMNGYKLTKNGILTELKNIDDVMLLDNASDYIMSEVMYKSTYKEFHDESTRSIDIMDYLLANSICVLQTRNDIYVLTYCNDILRLISDKSVNSPFATNLLITAFCLSKNGRHICKPVNLTLNEPYIIYPLDAVVQYIYSIVDKLSNNIGLISTVDQINASKNIYFITGCKKIYKELPFSEQFNKSKGFYPLDFKGTFTFRTISGIGSARMAFPIEQIEKIVFPE